MKILFLFPIIFFALLNLSMSFNINYGILTDDYGIVTEEDLRKEAEIAEPQPIMENFSPFMVWQCLPLIQVSTACDPTGDEIVSNSPGMQPLLTIFDGHSLFEFSTRRPCEENACNAMINRWKYLFEGEEVACISASYDQDYPVSNKNPWTRYSTWTINRIKSKKGNWSYFSED